MSVISIIQGVRDYLVPLTQQVVLMITGFVGVAVMIWAWIVVLGNMGYWDVLRHEEEIDVNHKVRTWKDVDASDKSKNSDYTGPRLETPIKLPFTERLFGHLLNDPHRDMPLLHVLVSSTCILLPMAYSIFVLYIYANFYIASMYGLIIYQFIRTQFFMHSMLHYRHFASHRPLFKISAFNVLSNLYLDPLMGIPPLVFLLHHPIMHHVANNGYYDISSTEQYRRDSWTSFANYWFRFQILAYIELPLFAWRTDRKSWFWAAILVIGSFFFVLAHLTVTYSGWATFAVFGLPWCLDHADDGKRNWCQHLFVVQYDSPAPANNFWDLNCGLSYILLDSIENRQQFNEGYHVVHHANGGKHWSEMPDVFYQQVDRMALYEHDLMCITWTDSSIWEVWVHVACGELAKLVKHKYVHIPTAARPEPPTIGEVVAELEARLKPLDPTKRKANEPQTQKRKQFQRQPSLDQDIIIGNGAMIMEEDELEEEEQQEEAAKQQDRDMMEEESLPDLIPAENGTMGVPVTESASSSKKDQ